MTDEKFDSVIRSSQYFEGTLQLRHPNDEVIEFIIAQLKANRDAYISKEVKVKNGLDLYFSSGRFLQNLGKKLQAKFGGDMKISVRLHSRNRMRSKDVYRVSVLYATPEIIKGDVVKLNNRIILVSSIDKMLHGRDLDNGKRISTKYVKKDFEILDKHKTKVMKVLPEIEVLDPDTFQGIKVRNPKMGAKLIAGENVTVAIDNGAWIIA